MVVAPYNAQVRCLREHLPDGVRVGTVDKFCAGPGSPEIERDRFDLWARQVRVDAAARNHAAVSGDVATREWIRDRIARTLDSVALTRIDTQLEELRGEVADRRLAAAAKTATALRKVLARAGARH